VLKAKELNMIITVTTTAKRVVAIVFFSDFNINLIGHQMKLLTVKLCQVVHVTQNVCCPCA